jgi:hypothetical protein
VAKFRLQPPQFLFVLLTFKLGLTLADLVFCHGQSPQLMVQRVNPGFAWKYEPRSLISGSTASWQQRLPELLKVC